MDWLQSLLESSTVPVITAFLLGLLTAVSPCPMATNITAIGFISRDIENRNRIFRGGILYTAGRMIAYAGIAIILIPLLRGGASVFAIQNGISKYGSMFFPPLLMLIGFFMLLGNRLNLPKFGFSGADRANRLKSRGGWGALFLGILFALAFCPTSAVFYFGMLIPMSAAQTGGYWLPVIFAIATSLPVITVSWLLAYSVAGLGKFMGRVKTFEKWFRLAVALLFIGVGIYYAVIFYF